MIKRVVICMTSFLFILLFTDVIHSEAAGKTIRIAVHKANIRSEPSNTANIIDKASRNDRFEVQQEKFGWYEIQLPRGGKGWVAGYIVVADDNQDSITTKQGVVMADRLHVRNNPSLSGDIMGKLHAGDRVNVTKESNGWTNINYNNQSAWVSSEYIRVSGEATKQTTSPSGFAYISTDRTNLRTGPDTSAPVITKGSSGERYPIVGQEGDWYKITLASGREAYVASWVVSSNQTTSFKEAPSVKVANRTPGLAGKTIVLDAGHGGVDPGVDNGTGIFEKHLTLQTTELLAQKLKAAGANVILTRSDDRHVSLASRASVANNRNADVFISIHYDSSYNMQANGFTTYYNHSYQYGLANTINQTLSKSLSLHNRGTRVGDYHVIRENSQPAVLLELGYLSNPHERAYITTASYQELVSNSIYQGLQSYFK